MKAKLPRVIKFPDAVKLAVEKNSPSMAGKIVDALRVGWGMNYEQCLAFFQEHAEITPSEFENLMYLADEGY